jgi:hypothetical protein
MKNVTLGLHTLALVSCVLGAVACVAEPAEMSTLPGGGLEPSPDTELLYGLDRADMVRLHSLVSDRFDLDAWLDANRAPFDCGRYGTLCRDVGEEAAYAITEASYLLALDGATIEDVNAYLVPAIVDATGAFAAEAEARGADERLANTCFFTGNANNERLKVTVHAVKPLIGDWHGSADCTYQVKTLGIWGGSSSANLTCQATGHLHTPSGTGQQVNGAIYSGYLHSVGTSDIKFYPAQPSLSQMHVTASGTGSKGGWSAKTGAAGSPTDLDRG